jgi:hypothetical protein
MHAPAKSSCGVPLRRFGYLDYGERVAPSRDEQQYHWETLSRVERQIAYHGVSVEMANSLNPEGRRLGAYFCLLATLLLYAPLAGAAWSAHSMACCTGDHCPIRGHHHQKPAASHEDCEHELGMSSCSMSCCQDEEKAATSALVFVLPDAQSLAALIPVIGASDSQIVPEIPRPARPVSPPPRTSPAIA